MAVIKIVPMPGAVGDKGDEGAPGAQGPQGPAGQNGLPGTPALWSYQGAYNSSAAYAVGDVVVYQGQLYYTKSITTAGTLPTNTTKFDLIAAKGADGTNGTNGTNGADGAPGAGFGIFYLGNYNPSSGYVPDIAVVRGSDGQLYLAKASGQLNDPVGNTAQWEVWIPKGQDGAPGNNGADALWNFVGAYDGGTSYAIGDVATYGGQLWYRTHANGGTVGNTPSEGFIWALLAAKGADGSGGTADTGDITFDGVQIIGAGTASGDGYGLGTIELVPDGDITSDQYLIIDPTSPNHIHIRAGGVQDASTADLFLGAEKNNVLVSDQYNNVKINSTPDPIVNTYGNSNQASNTEFMVVSGTDIIVGDTVRLYTGGPTYTVTTVTPEYPYAGLMTVVADGLSFITGEAYTFTREQSINTWIFEEDGTLYGPAMGGVKVLGLQNSGNNDLGLYANDADIYLQASSGAVTIAAPEVTITSNASPSSLNINTYSGAKISSARTSGYSDADKVVATLGDVNSVDKLSNGLTINGLIDDPEVNPAGTMALSVQGGGYTALMDLVAHSATFNGHVNVSNLGGDKTTTIETPTTINNDLTVTEDVTINGLTVGRGSGDTVFNTALGVASLLNNTTGDWNTALGIGTLQSNTTGESNTAVGVASLLENTIGSYNVATGYSTLRFNTTGNWNTADGYMALHNNTTGGSNTAVGHAALFENTTGTANTALGLNSLVSNTTGTDNTSVGHYSLYENIVGISNTAIGNSSLQNNTGNYNTAVGRGSLFANTTGDSNTAVGAFSADANTTGNNNTSVGSQSLGQNQTGIRNTAIGADSLYNNVSGDYNTAVGNAALSNSTSGVYNVAVGASALYASNGSANTAVGIGAGATNVSGERNIFIGYEAGKNETGSDKLYIDVNDTATPLIHGDFATNTLTVNGTLNVSTGATGTFQTSDSKIVTVTNGIITSIESLT